MKACEKDYDHELSVLFQSLEKHYPNYKWKFIAKWFPPFLKSEKGCYGEPYIGTESVPNSIKIRLEFIFISNDYWEPRYVLGSQGSHCYGYLYCLDLESFIKHLKQELPNMLIEQQTLFD